MNQQRVKSGAIIIIIIIKMETIVIRTIIVSITIEEVIKNRNKNITKM